MATAPTRTYNIASRASNLAQIQTRMVFDALTAHHRSTSFELSFMATEGDKNQSQALYLLGGKALWTKELEVALLSGEIDIIVHCLKDVPTTLPEGCELGAILEREDPSDCLVVKDGMPYQRLEDLPDGSVIGTSSVRRVAQLRRLFPKLVFSDVRGNLNTRLAKLDAEGGTYSALILATAGLVRLGFGHRITCRLGSPTLYYAVGQAALALEIRTNDEEVQRIVKPLVHWQTDWRCRAERACLRVLEGGCSVPVGVESTLTDEDGKVKLTLMGTVTSPSGDLHVEETVTQVIHNVEEAEEAGVTLAKALIGKGAGGILEAVAKDRQVNKS